MCLSCFLFVVCCFTHHRQHHTAIRCCIAQLLESKFNVSTSKIFHLQRVCFSLLLFVRVVCLRCVLCVCVSLSFAFTDNGQRRHHSTQTKLDMRCAQYHTYNTNTASTDGFIGKPHNGRVCVFSVLVFVFLLCLLCVVDCLLMCLCRRRFV